MRYHKINLNVGYACDFPSLSEFLFALVWSLAPVAVPEVLHRTHPPPGCELGPAQRLDAHKENRKKILGAVRISFLTVGYWTRNIFAA